ncbi:hypothetical protein LMG28688_06864 [Paraburkholderia caffeinitolerans]|uniref:Uncharacterized protein n=1 Tax=Paraburkholderia caffeinitolerans TaxID=1723730 RepID=A0A6J5GZ31_9BURK|nr:hypothetical protein [Paraburkholderia caffeinitolerans]CAB3808857.1 hypothetical protein LMG28688_06864 [Paraburkholderia caffeinitolerans]
MTYSSNDFSEDIVRCLVHAEVVEADAVSGVGIGQQADAAIAGIIAAGCATRAARFIALVLASDESRAALDATGEGAFADALRLAEAIAAQRTLELSPARAPFAVFVASLPCGNEWAKQIRLRSV